MDSSVVYKVFKALSEKEQLLLYKKLQNEFRPTVKHSKKTKPVLTVEDAIQHLLKNVFNN